MWTGSKAGLCSAHETDQDAMNPDLVGIRAGVTTLADQGGAARAGVHRADSPLLFESAGTVR